ncbi:nucleotidyltransferase domain-containing protein [Sporosarcina siberiensis]|uniref:Nucleotidyltransferase domain-containing protein n=1 Tax=Sporosarcina siberiensis TaxID=1365606 RepID=A0ABW4SDQ1_9BACL
MNLNEKANEFFIKFKEWSNKQDHINGVGILGSFARGDFHSKSDVDLTIISTNKDLTVITLQNEFENGTIKSVTQEEWGIVTFLRIIYDNELEVEYGVVTDKWVIEPLDERTKSVVTKGFKVLVEKDETFSSVVNFLN